MTIRRSLGLGATLALTATATLFAHDDDPKVRDRIAPIEAPAYRSAALEVQDESTLGTTFPASGMSLLAWLPVAEFGGFSAANDCWGYVSPSGREYAIIGVSGATGFVDVSNPGLPEIVAVMPGESSLWRDIKTYQQYAYAVSEGGGGIQIFDLTAIDSGTVTLANTIMAGPSGPDSHNVAIDEDSGFLYRCGGTNTDGLRIYDLSNPTSPAYVADWNVRYVHDAQVVTYTSGPYAGKQIAFLCGGFNGGGTETGLDVLDVTNKSNIIQLDRLLYPNGVYSHQAWLSEDKQYLYLNDELDENGTLPTTTFVVDVSDLSDVSFVSTFDNGNSAVGHNLYVRGNLIYEANYRSGLRIFDATNPTAPTEVAYFDTWPDDDNANFNGLWSVYPYLPSGVIIGSDIERGLFVWRLGEPQIEITILNPPAFVDPAGDTIQAEITELVPGGLVPGTERMRFQINDGAVTEVALTSLGGNLYEGTLPSTTCGDLVSISFTAEAADGFASFAPGPGEMITAVSTLGESVALEDNGETDTGWNVQNGASLEAGAWERGVPAGAGDRGDPNADFDNSGQCWLTENVEGNSDVDGGPSVLTSPVLDLTGLVSPVLTYARWFTTDDGNDFLDVEVSADGQNWTLVESVGSSLGWTVQRVDLPALLGAANSVQVRFTVADEPNDSVTEAAIDAVRIVEYACGPSGMTEDIDHDGDVDFSDLVMVLSAWGVCPPGPCPEDINGNGSVDFPDILALLAAWTL